MDTYKVYNCSAKKSQQWIQMLISYYNLQQILLTKWKQINAYVQQDATTNFVDQLLSAPALM